MVSAKPKSPTHVVEVSPEDVREGDSIVGIGERTVRAKRVTTEVAPCASQWRTHVHIEGGCYDTRIALLVQRGS